MTPLCCAATPQKNPAAPRAGTPLPHSPQAQHTHSAATARDPLRTCTPKEPTSAPLWQRPSVRHALFTPRCTTAQHVPALRTAAHSTARAARAGGGAGDERDFPNLVTKILGLESVTPVLK